MEFPRLVYRSASDHLLVNDQDQYDDAMADGWYGSVPEALGLRDAQGLQAKQKAAQEAEDARAKRLAAERLALDEHNRLMDLREADRVKAAQEKEDELKRFEEETQRLAAESAEAAKASRAELEEQARELGLQFDGRNSDASLTRMIDEVLKA